MWGWLRGSDKRSGLDMAACGTAWAGVCWLLALAALAGLGAEAKVSGAGGNGSR